MWLFFEDNDLIELFHEKSSSILRKYLYENDFSQNLLERQEEIDSVLINFVQEKLKEMKKKERKKKEETKENIRTISEQEIYKKILNKSNKIAFDWEWAIKMLKLSNIRSRINLVPAASESVIFKNILNKSKKIVSEWEGEMYFVYLPSYKQYSTSKKIKNRELILRTVTKLDIPIIDINTEVFNLHPDPLSLFPHRTDGLHYTVEGYHLIAKEIEKIIKADGINSTKLDN